MPAAWELDEDRYRKAREKALDFIARCQREDGAYAPSPDPSYRGNSDTSSSDLAAVTYAVVLLKTLGEKPPRAEQIVEFLQDHQRPAGQFVNKSGKFDPGSELAVLYNTTQGTVALRVLGARPPFDPEPAMTRFIESGAFRKLPWYTTSFFPLFYAAIGRPFPDRFRDAISRHMEANQADDGYLQDHVAATFHMAHFYRLLGLPTPRAERMVARVLKDQAADGGWAIKQPDWDVHSAFDAVFILRQLGGGTAQVKEAIARAVEWSLRCQNPDGGFGHFPGKHSDMDAVYFQLGTLIQGGVIPGARLDLPDASTLGWGHAMEPGRNYKTAGAHRDVRVLVAQHCPPCTGRVFQCVSPSRHPF
jgi:geranylgeranyl transferase type-2 subunit beta